MRRLLPILLLLAAAASAGNEFEDAALAAARQQGLTAEEVAARGYADTAALAGVKLGPGGTSPATFFYVHVRRHVVATLAVEEKAARVAVRQSELQTKLREAFPDAEIAVGADGKTWEIKKVSVDSRAVAVEGGSMGVLGLLGAAGLAGVGVVAWRRRRNGGARA